MQILYEKGQLKDLDEIYQLFQLAIVEMDQQQIPQWDSIYPNREVLKEDIINQELYVGKEEDKIVVVYVINMEADEQYRNGAWKKTKVPYRILHRVCVHPHYQNCGIGAATLSHIHEQMKKEQIEAIRLDAFSKNPYALKMYERAGYETVGIANFRKGQFYLMEKVLL